MKIIRCEICGSWLASNNPLLLKEHKDNCKPLNEFNAKHVSWCMIDVNNKNVKAAVAPNNRGKFKILWIEKAYDYMIGKYIDASNIRKVILKNAPDYCDDSFRIE
ncbi:MAG: hypothetical protein D6752_05145 [Candidatus Nitrosothermus koennekii]|nr:MAG: hypothetical protein D6752_05145 [Candidatus Nitrosothermus koennekii]